MGFKKFFAKQKERYAEYKAKAPERRESEIAKLKQQKAIETERAGIQIAKAKGRRAMVRHKPKSSGIGALDMGGSLFGGDMFGSGDIVGVGRKQKRKPRKRKPRSKGRSIIINY